MDRYLFRRLDSYDGTYEWTFQERSCGQIPGLAQDFPAHVLDQRKARCSEGATTQSVRQLNCLQTIHNASSTRKRMRQVSMERVCHV